MGYDLHITRRKNWVDSDNDIDAGTWLAYANCQTGLEIAQQWDLVFLFAHNATA